MKLISFLCIFLIEEILSNDSKISLFTSQIILNSNEVEHIVTESISMNSYELHLTIKSSNSLIKGKKNEGVWMYIIEDDGKSEKKEEKMKENYFISQYSGLGIKFTDKSIIGIHNNNSPLSESDFDIDKKTNRTRYEYSIKDKYQKGFELKITKNNKMISVELSSNGKDFDLCFFEELIKGGNSHIEIVSNLKGEKANFEISDIYYKAFSFTSDNSETNDIVDNEKINELYDKLSKVSQVLSSFSKYDTLLKTFESHPFDTIIQEHNNKIEKIHYINKVIEKSLKDSNANKKSNNITELMKIIRDVTFEKDSVTLMNDKLNEELISSINQLEQNQREMNETIYGLYDIVTKSMKELNEKTSSLEQYSFFKKVILLLLIVCFILLYSIYKSINEVPLYTKVSNQKDKIDIPA